MRGHRRFDRRGRRSGPTRAASHVGRQRQRAAAADDEAEIASARARDGRWRTKRIEFCEHGGGSRAIHPATGLRTAHDLSARQEQGIRAVGRYLRGSAGRALRRLSVDPQSVLAGRALFGARARQDTGEPEVAFVTGVLVDVLIAAPQRNHQRPRPGPGLRIVDRDSILQRIRSDASEALGQTQRVGCDQEAAAQIGGLDDQRVAVPVTARIAEPRVDRCRCVRPAIE